MFFLFLFSSFKIFQFLFISQKANNWANEFSMNSTNFLPAPQLSHEEEKVFEHAFNEAIKQNQG